MTPIHDDIMMVCSTSIVSVSFGATAGTSLDNWMEGGAGAKPEVPKR